ncbi:MAG TPA: hypothetical protein DEQ38_10865 [Elusimicrobia bacterium]|nr:MAG: hypothetical protein A2089_06685 [Elusimicrobia bacterium GWD2_63_28]HCC48597.1 hypothetical protein [Elusimicrobiota bacterium]
MNYCKEFPSKRAAALAAVLAAACCGLSPAFAGGPGSAGVQVLKTDVSPRALGMGGAFAAVADDAYAANYNPAGLGQLYLPEASAMYLSGFDDSKLQHLSFSLPLPVQGFSGFDKPVIGISALFSDSGRFVYNPIDNLGNVNSVSMDAESTRVLTLSYGEKVYSGEVDLEGYKAKIEQYLGLSVKYIGSELLETYSASALAFDGGWLMREPDLGLSLGVSISNFGTGIKYFRESTPLPTILRVGMAYQPPTVMAQSLLLTAEADMYLQESCKSIRGGLEYRFQEVFHLRGGYRAADDNSGPAIGLGVHYENFALDFGMTMGGEVFNTSQVAFTYKFSNWRTGEYKKKPQYRIAEEAPRQGKAKPAARQPSRPSSREPAKPAAKPKKDSDFFWIY